MPEAQKWPEYILILRHGQSEYNAFNPNKIPGYKEFRMLYEKEIAKLDLSALANGDFPSLELKEKALELLPEFTSEANENDTGLTADGRAQAELTAGRLADIIEIPDIIIASYHERISETRLAMIEGWRALGEVPMIMDDRIREQQQGYRSLYRDPRMYSVFNPKSALLHKFSDPYTFKNDGGGESFCDVRERCRSIISHILRKFGGSATKKPKRVMIISSERVGMCLRGNFERWGRELFLIENSSHRRPANCSFTLYRPKTRLVDGERREWMEAEYTNRVLYDFTELPSADGH